MNQLLVFLPENHYPLNVLPSSIFLHPRSPHPTAVEIKHHLPPTQGLLLRCAQTGTSSIQNRLGLDPNDSRLTFPSLAPSAARRTLKFSIRAGNRTNSFRERTRNRCLGVSKHSTSGASRRNAQEGVPVSGP